MIKLTRYSIIKWEFELKKPKAKGITLDAGIDLGEILKDDENENFYKYIVNIKKDTEIFNLDISYRFDFEKQNDLTEEQRRERIKDIITIDSSSLFAVFLKYCGLPPFPLLLNFKDNKDEKSPENQ